MADVWEILVANSSLVSGDVWEHLNAQEGGTGENVYADNIDIEVTMADIDIDIEVLDIDIDIEQEPISIDIEIPDIDIDIE